MRLKLALSLVIAITLIILAIAPIILAADPDIMPLGSAQTDPRPAYRALFTHIGGGGRTQWAQQAFDHAGDTYDPGTIIAPAGLPGGGFNKFSVTGPVNAAPALALNAEGTRVAVFRSTVTNTYGSAAWELADIRETLDTYLWGSLRYDILDEFALATADLSPYAVLIVPSVRWGNEEAVKSAISPAALANIKSFAENGGFVYAQTNGAVIVEAAGLLPPGTVNLAQTLVLTPGALANAGQLAALDPASPLSFSWLTNTLYLLTDPVINPGSLQVVAEYTNLSGPNQPAILTGEVNKGRVILVNGHPTAPTRRNQLPVFFNAILWALGQPAELFGDAVQVYNPDLDTHLLPAYEPGTPVSLTLTFANVWDTPLQNVVITEVITEGFTVDPISVTPAATVTTQTNPTQTVVVWNLGDVPPGEVTLNLTAHTDDMVLRKGEVTFATGQAVFTHDGRIHTVTHQPFTLTSRMAARLQLDRDLELDRQFYIPANGLYLDVTVPMENKEDTLASNIVLTDVVLLIAPIVALDDQETILDLNSGETIWIRNEPFFYPETTGAPYQPADGYTVSDTITLADWDGAYAVFDVPYGTHWCGLSQPGEIDPLGTGNCVTIPVSYTNYITITNDYKLLLPVKVLTWTIGDWPGYHYEEPALRYGLHSRELFSRTVTFDGDPGVMPEQLVIQGDGGSIYTHLGDYPIFYRDHLVSDTLVYVPQAPVTPLISYQDIWSRTHTATLRSAFYDVFSWGFGQCGPVSIDRHALLNVTFGMQADLNGDDAKEDILIYPSRLAEATPPPAEASVDLNIMIKTRSLGYAIPTNQMVIDMGVFKGLGIDIRPRSGDWHTSWSSPNAGVTLVDIETPSPAYDHLLFQHNVPADGVVIINLQARINSYADVTAEGLFKLHDGARFTYRQQAAGPSRYEVYDTHVQGVLGEAPQITIVKQGTPVAVSTYGDTVYYVFTLDDQGDPRQLIRNGPGDPFLQSYGFGDAAATTYIGGREEKQILHSIVKPGDQTRLRVELNNNTGVEWSNLTVTPQPPANILITPVYTDPDAVPPPIFYDIPFLHVAAIPDAGRGVYYFNIKIDPAYTSPRGQVVEIPIAVSGSGMPDDFKIPPARLGLEDAAGQVFHTYGPAQTLLLTDSLPSYVNLTGAAIATATQVDALTGATDPINRADIFNSLTDTLHYHVDESGQAAFTLPGEALHRLYTPTGDHRLFVVARGVISPASAGPNWANYGAGVSYSHRLGLSDRLGLTWHEKSAPLVVEAHGAAVRANYACNKVVTPSIGLSAAESADPSTCLLYAGENQTVTLETTFYNDGDYRAEGLTASLTVPPGVVVLNTIPAATEVTSETVTWSNLGDLAPGGLTTVYLEAFVPVNEAGVIAASSVQQYVEVINHTDGQFWDTYISRTITARIADDYTLPVVAFTPLAGQLYLPLIVKNSTSQPDLIVDSLVVSSNAVTVVVKNIGGGPVVDTFWVDVYLNPRQTPPIYNQRWDDIADEGLVWGVKQSLPAGGSLVLTIGDAFYNEAESHFNGIIAPATPIWAQVDSVNLNTPYGAVLESNEHNNVLGPVTTAEGMGSNMVPSASGAVTSLSHQDMPPRLATH